MIFYFLLICNYGNKKTPQQLDIAFLNAKQCPLWNKQKKLIDDLEELRNTTIFYLYLNLSNLILLSIKKKSTIAIFSVKFLIITNTAIISFYKNIQLYSHLFAAYDI